MAHERTEQARVDALDGIRGLALALVMAFHLDLGWARGGFLGVSMFFTLSGYLITAGLVRELERTGRVDYSRFLLRRVRRLVPLAAVVVLGVLITWLVLDDPLLATGVGADARAALLEFANWHFIHQGTSYADLFASPTPFLHFWSLAVEVQLYVVWPLVLWVLWRVHGRSERRRDRVGVGTLVLVALCSLGWMVGSFDLGYYGTHTRAAEFLVGAALALATRGVRAGADSRRRAIASVGAAAGAGAVLVLLLVGAGQGSSVWSSGGFLVVSAATVVLIVSSSVPAVRRVLASKGLGWLGRERYGFYLVHWPVFVVVTPSRTGWGPMPTNVLRLAVTVAFVVVLGRLVERPFMRRQMVADDRRLVPWSMITIGAVVAVSVPVAGASVRSVTLDVSPDNRVLVRDVNEAPTATRPPELVRLVAVGSTSDPTLLAEVVEGIPGGVLTDRRVDGCPVHATPEVRIDGSWVDVSHCSEPELAKRDVRQHDVIVITVGSPDLAGHRVDGVKEHPLNDAGNVTSVVRSLARDARVAGRPVVVVVEPGGTRAQRGTVSPMLADVVAADTSMRFAVGVESVGDAVRDLAGLTSAASGRRVLILGDSTGAGLGSAIFEASGQRVETMNLAQRGCPLIRADRIRWWDGTEFDLGDCPRLADAFNAFETFRPDVVLVSSSLMEQAEYREGDGEWFSAPGEEYARRHDEYLDALASAASSHGASVLAFDSPPLTEGAFHDSPMGEPDRIAGWNLILAAWDARWDEVTVLPWTTWLLDYEARHGNARVDGVHLADDAQLDLVRAHVLEAIDDAA